MRRRGVISNERVTSAPAATVSVLVQPLTAMCGLAAVKVDAARSSAARRISSVYCQVPRSGSTFRVPGFVQKEGGVWRPRPRRHAGLPSVALGCLVYRGCTATDRRADQRALLAADDCTHARTGRRRAADDERRLRLRPFRTHLF